MNQVIFSVLFLAYEDAKEERSEPKSFPQQEGCQRPFSVVHLKGSSSVLAFSERGTAFLHGPELRGSHSICLNFMQSLFLGATIAVSCQ